MMIKVYEGFVKIEEVMGGDDAVIEAARICYQSSGSDSANERLIEHMLRQGHTTPFEHAVMRFHVKCPLFVARQWQRHRWSTFNEKSLRYCEATPEFWVPDNVDDVCLNQLAGTLSHPGRKIYNGALSVAYQAYQALVKGGMAKEDARAILPMGIYTEFLWTTNTTSLMNYLRQRLDPAAQGAHRQYAEAVNELWQDAMPITASAWNRLNYNHDQDPG